MKLRCPVCHSTNSLEAYAADAAGRELLATLAASGALFKPLSHYLGLFRSKSRDLSHARALKLATEVLALPADPQALSAALAETVEAMHAKRHQGDDRPLSNHNYLLRVLETVSVAPAAAPHLAIAGHAALRAAPRGKRAQGMAALEEWGNE
ncbi:MAG: hypothetical protein RBR06_06185 [Desulfuromonadaceae bacterium]|nr:hypothetical protein [Desulfuromonadaceae bacterium]